MKLIALQAGPVAEIAGTGTDEWWDHPWRSGFLKRSITAPAQLGPLGLEGDAQADLVNHGGPDKAVCVYPAAHYPYWRSALGLPGLSHGAFGENFTLDGVAEDVVCIGDVLHIGSATVQISQPRQPCWKLARRWRVKDLAVQVEQTGRTGWYFRVLQPGAVAPGQALTLADRPHPEWPVALANRIMHHRKEDRTAAGALAACPALSASWRESLARRAKEPQPPSEPASQARLNPPA